MAVATLKSLHTYLRLLENASELKRKMPASSIQRTIKEGLSEISKLAGIDNDAFKDPQTIATVIGPQRFVMISGEPSVTAHVARIFDSSKVLLTVLIDAGQPQAAAKPLSPSWGQSTTESPASPGRGNLSQESALESLKPLLAGNLALTCRVFRDCRA